MKKKSIIICSIAIIVLLIIGVVVVLVGKGNDKNQLDNTESEMIESTEVVNFPSTETEISTEVETEVVEETKVETTNTNKNSNSGSVSNTNTNSNTNSNSGSVNSQPSAQSVGLPQYDNREYTSKEYTAIEAGYYNVAIDSATGQYVVLVKNAEEVWLADDLIDEYLKPMGLERVPSSCRGNWINVEMGMYLVSCGEVREITEWEVTEDTDPSNDNVVDEEDIFILP